MSLEDGDDSSRLSPEDAFAVLGNETRFEIVRTLWDLYEPEDPANVVKFADLYDGDTAVSFSDLYEAVGYGDSGNFNYHLEKLTDHFVRRTDAGYELTEAGFEIARAVVAGTVGEQLQLSGVEVDEPCPRCEAPVVVDYDNHHLTAACSQCPGIWQDATGDDGVLFTLAVPPSGLTDRTPAEAFHAALRYNLNRIRSFIGGICPDCSSAVEQSLDVCDDHEPGEEGGCPHCHRQHAIEVAELCHQCKSVARGPLTVAILAHPSVTAFYHDRGIVHDFASWETFRRGQTLETELLETDPYRIRVTIPCDGDRLRLTLDETLAVVDVVQELSTTSTD